MNDKLDEERKKQKEEREKRLRPLKEANELAEKAAKAAAAKDKAELEKLLDQIEQKKFAFIATMPSVLGQSFETWYWDLSGWDLGIKWLSDMLGRPNPDWKAIDDAVRDGWLTGAKHRIERTLKN